MKDIKTKNIKILAIESSCDETSVSVVENGNRVLSNIISTQIDIHKEYGGVVPEIASRHHIENILPVFEEAIEKAGCSIENIDYIAVTNTPGLVGSLLVGLMFAKALSYANKIPLIPVNHIDGHIFSNFIDNEINLPAVSLVVSGGHTNLYYIEEKENKIDITLLGETLDDAVGEVYDKVARVLGLQYPGGPEIERVSAKGKDELNIKKPDVEGYNFSFSGIKTYITNYVNNKKMKGEQVLAENVAKSLQEVITKVLIEKVMKAAKDMSVKTILVAGGVSANKVLRNTLSQEANKKGFKIHFPKMEYCTDNGAMIGCAAYYKILGHRKLYNGNNGETSLQEENIKDKMKMAEKYNIDAFSTKDRKK